ncbi:transposable element Tcb1 transposase [Trichonephila clavipes]|nr:transposable element Tcb1 transposase [Trichonephila clavipes]
MEAGWSARRVARQLGRCDCVGGAVGTSGSEKCYLHEDQAQNDLDRPVVEKTTISHTAPIAGVMVWCAIAYNKRSPLVLIRGTMTAQRYVHDILQPHVLPLMQRLPSANLQQDNARPHTARVSQNCLRTVTSLPWPTRSPDLSPIELIWDHLGWRVGHPTSLNEQETRLQQIWNEMSQDI